MKKAIRPAIFKWRHIELELILCAVRWSLRYSLSFRDVEGRLRERGLEADHTTSWRWVQRDGSELDEWRRRHLKPTKKSWRVDETDVRVKGRWCSLSRAIDSPGVTIDFVRSGLRDAAAATRLFCARRYGCRVLIASTSEVYGKGSRLPFSEDDDVVLGATSRIRWAYAASKMVDEFLGLAYGREYELPVVIVRLFNTVGPRQTGRYGMVIPRFVRQAHGGEPITVYGDGTQSRCFCDVADVVRALIGLAEHPDALGSPWCK